ncbi:MAG: Type IV secretory pathway, VirB3-like protein [Syntrophorhabdus sp. PtaB.Bin006]|nr:MAG: Type IV secretory pathway, VirB3-like protein [Syntrophorhabdus sp. PtaB.Bin006]
MDGYEVPLHRALTEQILMGGVPRPIAILNGTIGAAFGIGLHSFYVIPFCLFVHIAAVVMTKRDPQFFDCFRRHIKQKAYYAT